MTGYTYKNPRAKALSSQFQREADYNANFDYDLNRSSNQTSGVASTIPSGQILPDPSWWNNMPAGAPSRTNFLGNDPSYGQVNLATWKPKYSLAPDQAQVDSLASNSIFGDANAFGDTADLPGAWGQGLTGGELTGPGFDWGGFGKSLADPKGLGGNLIGAANVGIGAFNAWMGKKNQNFLHDYYGKQQAMQTADFANNARSANMMLEERSKDSVRNRGMDLNSAEGKAAQADYMTKWGMKESF